jgi:hypothetical protein
MPSPVDGLHDVTAVTTDGIDHELERGIDNGAGLFRVEILHQLHRALDISEQRRHRLALAVGSGR